MTEKPKPYPHTFENVLDYTHAQAYIDTVLGYDQRSAHEKFPEQGEYLDFWHYVLEAFIDTNHFSNDSFARYGPHSFEEFAERCLEEHGADDWRTVIAKVWAEEFPDPECQSPDERGYTIWMSW